MDKPPSHLGLKHLALTCKNLDACVHFYSKLLGMDIVWHPDPDNIYLSSGSDNLALHRAPSDFNPAPFQHLDHFGFFLNEKGDVDLWHDYFIQNEILIIVAPKDHRDGTRSFYCLDPDRNTVQMIWMP